MNKVFQVIYSEARNGYVVVSELAKAHGKGVHSRRRKSAVLTAAVLSALASFSWAVMPEAQAATVNQPVTVDKPGQNVTDDFDVKDCTAPAAIVIAASAAKTTDDVTNVGTKSITAIFSNQSKADGIRVQADYPGTVKLADGLHIALTSDGNNYDTTGIILAGVDKSSDSKGSHDESVNANDEFIANGNKISDTRVEVGNGTSITVDAGLRELEENENRNRIFAVGLENHFGHMKAGNDVTLSVNSGKFS